MPGLEEYHGVLPWFGLIGFSEEVNVESKQANDMI